MFEFDTVVCFDLHSAVHAFFTGAVLQNIARLVKDDLFYYKHRF